MWTSSGQFQFSITFCQCRLIGLRLVFPLCLLGIPVVLVYSIKLSLWACYIIPFKFHWRLTSHCCHYRNKSLFRVFIKSIDLRDEHEALLHSNKTNISVYQFAATSAQCNGKILWRKKKTKIFHKSRKKIYHFQTYPPKSGIRATKWITYNTLRCMHINYLYMYKLCRMNYKCMNDMILY